MKKPARAAPAGHAHDHEHCVEDAIAAAEKLCAAKDLRFTPLRTYLDALCQITVQCGATEAEAPFALGAMDYYWRGTGHVRGGIGQLASALAGGCFISQE